MCDHCDEPLMSRRALLGAAALGVAAAATGAGTSEAEAAGGGHHEPATFAMTPDEALARLKAGNDRYIAAPQACALELNSRRPAVAQKQSPWATIVACADSRVPPELVFGGLGLGELFVARNAGNLVDTATMGTIEYGALHLGSPLIVVLGHERCGAVAAAVDVAKNNTRHPGSIGRMIQPIVPIARALRSAAGDHVDNTVRESARRTAARITKESEVVAELVKAGKIKVVAARYDLDDGKIEFLEAMTGAAPKPKAKSTPAKAARAKSKA